MVNAALSKRAFVWVGLISYSLYLWHWPVLVYARVLMGTAVLPIEVGGAAVAISLIMAWLSFRFVERPFRAPSSNRLSRRSIFAASALSVMTVTGVGWFLHVSDGFPARLPASATAMAAFVDHGNARRADCFDRTPSEGLCAIGKSPDENNRVDFLFWGDSHADAFMPGVDWTADRLGQSGVFAGRSACPPIFDIERVSAGRDCTTFNESVWSWLESRVDAPLVILGARWTLSVEGTRYRGEAGGDVRLDWIGDPEARPVDADNAALVEAGLNATLHKLLATGRSVILLGPVPEVGRNVPVALARKALLGWAPGASVTRQDYDARASRTERILMRIAGSHAGVRYIPLSDLFCDARVCLTTTTDGQPLYVDDDHISHTAAISLLPPRLEDIWRAVER